MGTNEYLDQLDYEQLEYAKCRCEELLEKKRQESKVPLWVVEDEYINYAWFPESDYLPAVDRLCEEIRKESTRRGGNLSYTLIKRRYNESEVAGLLAAT